MNVVQQIKLTFLLKNFSEKKMSNIMNTKSIIRPSKIYMVPLPDFIVFPEEIENKQRGYFKILLTLLFMLIWPRGRVINKEEKMSPLLRMVRSNVSAKIYDNPSMAAVIDFKWNATRNS